MSMKAYVKAFEDLKKEYDDPVKFYEALLNYEETYCKTVAESTHFSHSLLLHMYYKYGVTIEDSEEYIVERLWEKKDYFANPKKFESGLKSYNYLKQKVDWEIKDFYKHLETTHKQIIDYETMEKLFLPLISLNATFSNEDDDQASIAETIADPKSIDPEFKAICQEFLLHVLRKILANLDKLSDQQSFCLLNALSGESNEHLSDLSASANDSAFILSQIAEAFDSNYGYKATDIYNLKIRLPRKLSCKTIGTRLSEAKKIMEELLAPEKAYYLKYILR